MKTLVLFARSKKLADLKKLLPADAAREFEKCATLKIWDAEKGGALTHVGDTQLTVLWHLGAKDEKSTEEYQNEGAKALRSIRAKLADAKKIDVTIAFDEGAKVLAAHLEKGMLLASYPEDLFKSKKSEQKVTLKNVGDKRLHIIADAIDHTRRLVSTPANLLHTETFLDEIKQLKKLSKAVSVKILREKELKKEQMGLLLAVASGGRHEAALAVVEYTPPGTAKDAPVILVGKGLIYDAGGYGIKPGEYMADMYADMAGAATVVGVIGALAKLGVKRRVVGVMGICENLINEVAMKNGDILTSKKGLTVEVLHTDAEGRLVLADCLTYAQEKYRNPAVIFDFATLTGAVVYALGEMYTGSFTDSDELAGTFEKIGRETNDWVMRGPFDHFIRESVKGDRSDIINTSKIKSMLGHSTAAAFLAEFVDDTKKWVHFDIAGTGMRRSQKRDYDPKGLFGSGGMVHTMIEFLSRDEKAKAVKTKR